MADLPYLNGPVIASPPPTQQQILDEVGDDTCCRMFMQRCAAHPHRTALVDRADGVVRRQTWAEYQQAASEIAMGLVAQGIRAGDRVAIMVHNRPEHVIADVGAMLVGATPVSIYTTFTGPQIAHIVTDADVKVAFVEDEFLATWRQLRDAGDIDDATKVVVVRGEAGKNELTFDDVRAAGREAMDADPDDLERRWTAVTPEDDATIIYTSGTTGPPKGVRITHRNVMFQLGALVAAADLPVYMRAVSYLPLAHVAERVVSHYGGIKQSAQVEFVPDLNEILTSLVGTRPQIMMAVPRVWEKMHARMLAALDEQSPVRRKVVLAAIDNARTLQQRQRDGQPVPMWMRATHALTETVLFSRLRARLGMDRCRHRLSGGGPISGELLEFFAAIGLEIDEVYGMTESTAVISWSRPGHRRMGTVGVASVGTEMSVADDGEILTRGPHVTPGYLHLQEATAEAIDADGWLHTGDLGAIDDDGYLTIKGRKKELIITAGGKNLSPNNIEDAIREQSDLIAQVCAVGDARPYVGALIVLDPEVAPGWCKQHGVAFESLADAVDQDGVKDEVERAVAAGNEHLARVEQVKRHTLLPDDWTVASGELTPTMKLKRPVIHEQYADAIEALYERDT